jgi:hypothetical protein
MTKHCIGNYEINGYDDSDFVSVFFDTETKKISHETVGSTRYGGGVYGNALTTDETVWAEVKKIRAEEAVKREIHRRNKKAAKLLAIRKTFRDNGVNTCFMNAYSLKELEEIAALFTMRIRNKFKVSMREQVRGWKPGQYRTPLSPKQYSCIVRPRCDIYGRPNALAREESFEGKLDWAYAMQWRGIGKG